MKYKIWDKQEILITPIGEILNPEEVFSRYPMARLDNFKFIICDAPINMSVFMEFEQTKQLYKDMGANITDDMTDQEVLDAISEYENKKNIEPALPTPEERIASALEFQAMMMLPTMEGDE